jgi:8-oxo-dGTP pyrophosphatase MutT (NUDIX family)
VPVVCVAPRHEAPLGPERAALDRPRPLRRCGRRLLRGRRLRLSQLDDLIVKLERALAGRTPGAVDRPGARQAAVAVVLGGTSDPALVLIRRRVREGDPWSGQMAFPGGFRGSEAEPLELTAVRETLEETGLDLAVHGRLLGRLEDLSPRIPQLPPLVVGAFVFAVSDQRPLAPGDEADEAFWAPLRDIFDPGNRTSYPLTLPGGTREHPAVRLGDRIVWGLTERILSGLQVLLES